MPKPSEFQPPTPNELRALLKKWGATQRGAASVLCVNDRTMRRWMSGEARMTYTALYVLAHQLSGKTISASDWRDTLLHK